jgi:PP-loop superfamily ATP-utilizing enzyme
MNPSRRRVGEYLGNLGFRQFRVRDHGDLAVIEVAKDEMEAIIVPIVVASSKTRGFGASKWTFPKRRSFYSRQIIKVIAAENLRRLTPTS